MPPLSTSPPSPDQGLLPTTEPRPGRGARAVPRVASSCSVPEPPPPTPPRGAQREPCVGTPAPGTRLISRGGLRAPAASLPAPASMAHSGPLCWGPRFVSHPPIFMRPPPPAHGLRSRPRGSQPDCVPATAPSPVPALTTGRQPGQWPPRSERTPFKERTWASGQCLPLGSKGPARGFTEEGSRSRY